MTYPYSIFFIDQKQDKKNSARFKAPEDICSICEKMGFQRFTMPVYPQERSWIYRKLWLLFQANLSWLRLGRLIPDDATVICQHPFYGIRMAFQHIRRLKRLKKTKFIVLIHDLESLRGGIKGVIEKNTKTNQIADTLLLREYDAVICHNEHMRQYLIGQGIDSDKLVNLEIFDYLCDTARRQPDKAENPSIAIAGNLAIGKCGYIYKILDINSNSGLIIHLYGNRFQEDKVKSGMMYHGSFTPEELIDNLEGDFGLVWDGDSVESCTGNTGEYLKYNNPHKASMFLAAGMPIIVWSKAAIADFVIENDVGLTVDSLLELKDVIESVTYDKYIEMCKNAVFVSEKIRNGYYASKAISYAIEYVL